MVGSCKLCFYGQRNLGGCVRTSIGQISLIELVEFLKRKEMIVNKDYQRSDKVWPIQAKTYFIDTILEGYPFPKIYLYQSFNEKVNRPIKEIIDGQQRV